MSIYVINQNNIDIIYEKCVRYIVANKYQYERLQWQADTLDKKTFYNKFYSRDVYIPLGKWLYHNKGELEKMKPIYELAENILSCYLKHNEAFQEMHVNSVHMEHILCY